MKHPGPWRLDDKRWLVQRECDLPIVDNNGEMVCATWEEESEEHVRLILAAPELLAALSKYVERDKRNRDFSASDDPRTGGRECPPDELERSSRALIDRIEKGEA